MGKDNDIKVWDYYFRGKPSPENQTFSLSEDVTIGFLSNDMEMKFVCVGRESNGETNGLYLWRFVGETYGDIVQIDENIQEKISRKKVIIGD